MFIIIRRRIICIIVCRVIRMFIIIRIIMCRRRMIRIRCLIMCLRIISIMVVSSCYCSYY